MPLGTIFKTVKDMLAGEVLQRVDTKVNSGWATLSLRLKLRRGERYVVFAAISSGEYEYFHLTREEFLAFSDAVQSIRAKLDAPLPLVPEADEAARQHPGVESLVPGAGFAAAPGSGANPSG